MTVVIDTSAMVAALADADYLGDWAGGIVRQNSIAAPELLFPEVTNTLRRLEIAGQLSNSDARGALDDLLSSQVTLYPFAPFARRVWELRFNLTAYDAWYVALAEAMSCPLATLDVRIARASGTLCEFLLPHSIA